MNNDYKIQQSQSSVVVVAEDGGVESRSRRLFLFRLFLVSKNGLNCDLNLFTIEVVLCGT